LRNLVQMFRVCGEVGHEMSLTGKISPRHLEQQQNQAHYKEYK